MIKTTSLLCAVCLTAAAGICHARTVRETTYPYDRIWSTVVRFLRVDNGYTVVEQDKETGYVLFEYQDAGRKLNGAMELIHTERNGRETTSVGLNIQQMPTYVESVLMDKLVRKLRDEYGEPPTARLVRQTPSSRSTSKNRGADDEDKTSDGQKASNEDNIDNDDAHQ